MYNVQAGLLVSTGATLPQASLSQTQSKYTIYCKFSNEGAPGFLWGPWTKNHVFGHFSLKNGPIFIL